MDADQKTPTAAVIPDPEAVRRIGLLNIIFASILLAYIGIQMLSALANPYIVKAMEAQEQQQKALLDRERRDAIAEARSREEAEKDPAEREKLKAERRALEAAPPKPTFSVNFATSVASDPRIRAFAWTDYVTGLALNLAMLASGIGLRKCRPGGRPLALWVAGLKIVRLAILATVSATFVAPLLARTVGTPLDQQMASMRPAGRPPFSFAKLIGVAAAAGAVGGSLIGMIYPAIVIGVLTRPGARAACDLLKAGEADPWS